MGYSVNIEKTKPVTLEKLDIYYDPETDTLDIGNGRAACFGEDVAENFTALTTEEGDVAFVVLSQASEVLFPYLYEAMKARAKE